MADTVTCYFAFDDETREIVNDLGFIPAGCYCTTTSGVFVKEHAYKNRLIVQEYIETLSTLQTQ